MIQSFAPIFFTGIAALVGGSIFSVDTDASMYDVCEGAGLFGGILASFFLLIGIP